MKLIWLIYSSRKFAFVQLSKISLGENSQSQALVCDLQASYRETSNTWQLWRRLKSALYCLQLPIYNRCLLKPPTIFQREALFDNLDPPLRPLVKCSRHLTVKEVTNALWSVTSYFCRLSQTASPFDWCSQDDLSDLPASFPTESDRKSDCFKMFGADWGSHHCCKGPLLCLR